MKRALIITTVSGFVPQFEMNNVRILESMGYEVHYATNYKMPVYGNDNRRLDNTGIIRHQIDFVRSPLRVFKNIKAFKQLKELMNKDRFDLIHCHTPMGGVLGRLAAKVTKTSPVIYTAHGFHFFKGAPLINWLLYYPVERILARYTDVLITINDEDYIRAKKFILRRNGSIEKVNGIGIRTSEVTSNIGKELFLKKMGIPKESFIITSVGELSKRKNHKAVVKALAKLSDTVPIVYLICGDGNYKNKLKKLTKQLNIDHKVLFLGYRQDIKDILSITDCFAFPSLQEGLPVALMEAMVSGLPVVCSEVRGNTDLIDNEKGGLLVEAKDVKGYVSAIKQLVTDEKLRTNMGMYNKRKIENYKIDIISEKMNEIYSKIDSMKVLNQERVTY